DASWPRGMRCMRGGMWHERADQRWRAGVSFTRLDGRDNRRGHEPARLLRGEGVSRIASRIRRSEWPLHRNGSRRIQLRSPCLPHGRRHARRPRGQVMTPDFDALRAERNAARDAWVEKMRAEGWELSGMCSLNHRDACYCACAIGGPCEHNWN